MAPDNDAVGMGMRILVAANVRSVCNSTAKLLRTKSYSVYTCTSGQKLLDMLRSQSFDIVVAESDPKASVGNPDPVDGLNLLGLDYAPPVVVAMDQSNQAGVSTAVQNGAVDVIGLPMCKQQERLINLWQHGLRRRAGGLQVTGSTMVAPTTTAGSGTSTLEPINCPSSTPNLEIPELLGTCDVTCDSHKDELITLEDLELEPLDYSHYEQRMGGACAADDDLDGTLAEVTSHLLGCASGTSSVEVPETPNVQEAELRTDAFSSDEAVSSLLSTPLGSCTSATNQMPVATASSGVNSSTTVVNENKRSWSAVTSAPAAVKIEPEDKNEAVPTGSGVGAAVSLTGTAETAESLDGADSEATDEKKVKKPKVEWTRELHDKFVQAVEMLGADKAVPSRILERMGSYGTGLTRQNIASHLQKYRYRTRSRVAGANASKAAVANTSAPLVQTIMQPVQGGAAVPVTTLPQGAVQLVQGTPMPMQGGTAPQGQWVQTMQMWGPWPQGTVLYNHLGQPIVQPGILPASSSTVTMPLSKAGPTPMEVHNAIKEVLANPKAKPPLGLTLDATKIVDKVGKELIAAAKTPMATAAA